MSLPESSSPAVDSRARASLQTAIEQIESYPVARGWRPAFLAPLSVLPHPPRMPLADLPGKRPAVMPFGGEAPTIAGALHALRQGALSATTLLDQLLAAGDRLEHARAPFTHSAPLAELWPAAQELDRELRAGICRGALHGIPIVVDDLFDVAGMPGRDGSIARADAGAVRLLKAAGALILGKIHSQAPSPGNTASGAASAVAGGMSLGALAIERLGSVRAPAALCGLVGCKPTFGLAPGDGLMMGSWSLDHVGYIALTVEDAALMLDVLDPTPPVQYSQALHKSMRGVRIGVPAAALEGAGAGIAAAFQHAVTAMRQAGAEVVDVATPSAADFDLAAGIGLIVDRAEAITAGAEPMDAAAPVTAVHYLQAQRVREDLRWRMLRSFDSLDAFLTPTKRIAVPARDEAGCSVFALARNCILWSVLGFPAISLPCGRTPSNLPAGAQLVAAPYEDARLLAIAAALELELSRG